MFTDAFTRDPEFDLDAYFKALISVAKADGNLNEIEEEFIKDQATLLNYELGDLIDQDINLETLHLSESSPFTRKILIRDCISLAYIDDHYDEREKAEIQRIGQNMQLSSQEINAIESWLLSYWDLMKQAEELFASS